MAPLPTPNSHDYPRIVQAVRLELEDAGNPAFLVAIHNPAEGVQASPVVFSSVRPCNSHAERLAKDLPEGQQAFIVSRAAAGDRQTYEVLVPRSLKKVYTRQEVIEASFATLDGPV